MKHFRLTASARRVAALLALGGAWAGAGGETREGLLAAYRQGMSLDSLYWMLAREAMLGMSFDTALAFNLSIPTPAGRPFKDSVLTQRYRLYVLSGLHDDARALKDSLPGLVERARPRRPPEWEWKLLSGVSGEKQSLARSYPSRVEVPGIDTAGWLVKNQGRIGLPLPSPATLPLSLSLGYELAKTYYKDSLDYRGELLFQASLPSAGLSAGAGMEMGRITGVGNVHAAKGDATWFSLAASGTWVATTGFEGEWDGSGEKRYEAAWASLYREWELGARSAVQASLAATWLGMASLEVPGMGNVIFVDDVSKTQPVHYKDASFRDTVSRTPAYAAYFNYVRAIDSLAFACPQNAVTLRSGLGYTHRIGWGIQAGLGGTYSFSFYPDRYRWKETRDTTALPGGPDVFRFYALNQADGQYYRGYLEKISGGFTENYLPTPLEERERLRMDHRFGGDLGLSRRFGRRMQLSLAATAERTYSTLADEASVWIPEWDYGVSLRWTLSGGGR